MMARLSRASALLIGLAACVLAAAVLYVAWNNVRERKQLVAALRERNAAALDESRRATRRINLLTEQIGDLTAQVQALSEQVVAMGAMPVMVPHMTTTTVRRSGVTTVPRTVPRPGPATTTTRPPSATSTTTRPTCSTLPIVGVCLP